MSDAASLLAAVEYLCVEQGEEQEEEWFGDGAVLLKVLPSEIWWHILSFVDPWTLVSSVSCTSKRFQQLFRMQMHTTRLQSAFYMNSQLSHDATFLATLVMTMRLFSHILQYPKDITYLFPILSQMKKWLYDAVFHTTTASYHILCKPWSQQWLETSCLTPFVQLLSDQRNFVYGTSYADRIASERTGLLLILLQQACENRLKHSLILDPYWKSLLVRARCTLRNNKLNRRQLSNIPPARRRASQPYTVERKRYVEDMNSQIVTTHPELLRSAVSCPIRKDTDILPLFLVPATVLVKPCGEVLVITECEGDKVIDETILCARYILVPYFLKYLSSSSSSYSTAAFSF